MRAARVEPLTPFPLASSANCLFHASKPADVLPHCAAPALLVIHTSATKNKTVTVLNCPPSVILNSFRTLCVRRMLPRDRYPDEASSPALALSSPGCSCRRGVAPQSVGAAVRLSRPESSHDDIFHHASTSVFPKWAKAKPQGGVIAL